MQAIRMSSKGQVVIPKQMRKRLNASEGTLFIAIEVEGTIILKPVEIPTRSELMRALKGIAHDIPQMSGEDLTRAVHKVRSSTRTSSSQPRSGPKA